MTQEDRKKLLERIRGLPANEDFLKCAECGKAKCSCLDAAKAVLWEEQWKLGPK